MTANGPKLPHSERSVEKVRKKETSQMANHVQQLDLIKSTSIYSDIPVE